MDFHVSREQRQMVASVRDLAQSEFKPKAGRRTDGRIPGRLCTPQSGSLEAGFPSRRPA
jgi:hypothetical protein